VQRIALHVKNRSRTGYCLLCHDKNPVTYVLNQPDIYLMVALCTFIYFTVDFSDEPYTFQVKFRQAENYPVDLYFLMDVSVTMEQFRETLKNMSYILGE